MTSSKDHDGYLAKLQQIQHDDAARLDAFRQADEDRKALFEEVLTKYKDLNELRDHLTFEINDLKLVNRTLNYSVKELNGQLDNIKHEQDSSSLVGVFIDGDGAKFHEKLIKDGVEGGELAAQNIKDAIKKQLKESYPGKNTDNWQIIVWYITALDGLASVYQGSLSQKMEYSGVNFRESLRRFAIGLNRGADYNFNFIDVGGGKDLKLKEITDAKLRETFKMMLPHCRHVFFAGCHDEGYVTFLSPYKHNQQIAPKITLIETHGTRPKYHELGFGMTKFPQIFRTEDFSLPPTSYPSTTSPVFASQEPTRANSVASPFPAIENRAPTPVMSPGGAASWASSARNGLPPSSRMIDITPAKRASDGHAKKYYLVNAHNERVDEPLPKPPQPAYDQMTARIQNENGGLKFCNQCNFFGPETCNLLSSFRHGKATLTPGEELVLRQMVRGLPCSESSWCADVKCPYGHNCRYGSHCKNPGACKFASTHHVNTTPSRKVFEDGSFKLI